MKYFKCKNCSFESQTLIGLKSHFLFIHKSKNHIYDKINQKLYICKECDFVDTNIYNLQKHFHSKHKKILTYD